MDQEEASPTVRMWMEKNGFTPEEPSGQEWLKATRMTWRENQKSEFGRRQETIDRLEKNGHLDKSRVQELKDLLAWEEWYRKMYGKNG